MAKFCHKIVSRGQGGGGGGGVWEGQSLSLGTAGILEASVCLFPGPRPGAAYCSLRPFPPQPGDCVPERPQLTKVTSARRWMALEILSPSLPPFLLTRGQERILEMLFKVQLRELI